MARRRITVDLEESLLRDVDERAAEWSTSRNELIAESVKRMLRQVEREQIDAAFGQMGKDLEYQAELLRVEAEMAPASDEAWRMLDAPAPPRRKSP